MHYLTGHAIVSADDCIADAAGHIPKELHNERDWALFQTALDRSVLTIIGRASHEAAPNTKRRPRLIVSGGAIGLERRADGFWLNPTVSLESALKEILPNGGEVAIVGGQGVFDFVGASRLSAFHLARARRLLLPGGRGLFRACEFGMPAAAILLDGGLSPGEENTIDPEADVTLTIWERSGPTRDKAK